MEKQCRACRRYLPLSAYNYKDDCGKRYYTLDCTDCISLKDHARYWNGTEGKVTRRYDKISPLSNQERRRKRRFELIVERITPLGYQLKQRGGKWVIYHNGILIRKDCKTLQSATITIRLREKKGITE